MAILSTATAAPRESEAVRVLSPAATAALKDVLPVLVSVVPFAIAIGATIGSSPAADLAGWSGAPLLYAGSAHLAAVTLLGAGASWITVVTTGLAINARFAVYGAALSPLFRDQPRWFRWIAPHFIIDQIFALAFARRVEEREDPAWFRTYYLVAVLAIGAGWLPGVAAGILAGPVIPASWPIEFTGAAALAGLLAPGLRSRAALAAATAGAVASVALEPVAGSGAIILAALLGMSAGSLVARTARRGPAPAETKAETQEAA